MQIDLKQFVETHPLIVLATTFLSAASLAAGLISYLYQQQLEVRQARFDVEISSAKHGLQKEIDDLRSHLTSVERRVEGGREIQYVDLTKTIIDRNTVPRLIGDYQSIAHDELLVSPPLSNLWSYKVFSRSEFAALQSGKKRDGADAQVKEIADICKRTGGTQESCQDSMVHMWWSSQKIRIRKRGSSQGEQPQTRDLIPSVRVQALTDDFLKSTMQLGMQMFVSAMGELAGPEGAKKLDNVFWTAVGARSRKDFEGKLDAYFNTDMATVMLMAMMQDLLARKQEAQTRFVSCQKIGNILYLHTQDIYDEVEVEGEIDKARVYVDKEFFFVSKGDKAITVMVEIPSMKGHQEAYAWVQGWFNGLKIPM
jgi:hypothetical protein